MYIFISCYFQPKSIKWRGHLWKTTCCLNNLWYRDVFQLHLREMYPHSVNQNLICSIFYILHSACLYILPLYLACWNVITKGRAAWSFPLGIFYLYNCAMWTLWDVESRYRCLNNSLFYKSHVKWYLLLTHPLLRTTGQLLCSTRWPDANHHRCFCSGTMTNNKPCFWLWRKPEHFGGNPTQTWGEHANSTQKGRP